MFKIFRSDPFAVIPKRAEDGAAGYDLFSIGSATIPAQGQAIIDTGIVIEIPSDCYARIAPRSGLAAKHGIATMAGVVDSSYRDTIKVILINHGPNTFTVNIGDRIAQMIFERIYTPTLTEVEYQSDLCSSTRGTGGFGSSGI
jgi:dUTP pyrophosphatase